MEDIDQIQKKDYKHMATFLTTNWKFGEKYWLDRFDFVWDRNPAFREDPLRGFILKDKGKILGFLGNFPIKFQLGYKPSCCANGFSFLIDPRVRGMGIGKQLVSYHVKSCHDKLSITTTPSKVTVKIAKSKGYEFLPRGIGDHFKYTIIPIDKINSFNVFFNLLKKSRSLSAINEITYNMAILARGIYRNFLNRVEHADGWNTVKIDNAGKEFDELWENTKFEISNTNIRDAEIVNWYLLPTLDADREIYAAYKDAELSGFIVVRTTNFESARLLLCVDLWTRTFERKKIIQNLITFSVQKAAEKECDALLLPHFSKKLSAIYHNIGSGYRAIGAPRNDLYLSPRNRVCNLTENNSYVTYINGDRFLSQHTV